MYISTCIGVYINIIAKHRTLLAKVCFGQLLELWPADTVVVGLVLLNTAGPGLFSTSFTSPYKQQEFVSMLSSKTHLAKAW